MPEDKTEDLAPLRMAAKRRALRDIELREPLSEGGSFYPSEPELSDFTVRELGRSIGRIQRYGGHAPEPNYTVAEHSLYITLLVEDRLAVPALLHDAHEAFTGDLRWPAKQVLPDYCAWEARVERVVRQHFSPPSDFARMEGLFADPKLAAADRLLAQVEMESFGWRGKVTDDDIFDCLKAADPNSKTSCYWPTSTLKTFRDGKRKIAKLLRDRERLEMPEAAGDIWSDLAQMVVDHPPSATDFHAAAVRSWQNDL